MNHFLESLLLTICIAVLGCSSPNTATTTATTIPKLVVVVSIDQYRGDYLELFANPHKQGGFNRLTQEGAWYRNCMYNHANTMTGPGHATLLTGAYPYQSGVPANTFCERLPEEDQHPIESYACQYCAEVNNVVSANNVVVPTIGSIMRQKWPSAQVVGLALKDRASVLMAGKDATAALWFDAKSLAIVTSTAFPDVPYLSALNEHPVSVYQHQTWQARPETHGIIDSVAAEGAMATRKKTFPHILPAIADTQLFVDDFLRHPASVEYLFSAVKKTIALSGMGADSVPDLLCVGISTTDFLGHTFGPNSREVAEMYHVVDCHLDSLITFLDSKVGRANFLLVVTSDHGVAPIPEYLLEQATNVGVAVDAGRIRQKQVVECINNALNKRFPMPKPPTTWVQAVHEPWVYLSHHAAQKANISQDSAASVAAEALRALPGIAVSITKQHLERGSCGALNDEKMCQAIRNSYYPGRSGDVVLYPKPLWIFGSAPATHGTPYQYDQHVPLLLLGSGFTGGQMDMPVEPTAIAPTIAAILGLPSHSHWKQPALPR
jgi:hypothetical protein